MSAVILAGVRRPPSARCALAASAFALRDGSSGGSVLASIAAAPVLAFRRSPGARELPGIDR